MKKPDLLKIYSEINPLQTLEDQSKSNARIKSTDLTIAWILLRMTGNKLFKLECNQKPPDWTYFCKLTSLKVSLSLSLFSPVDINVVYTMMLNVKKILSSLHCVKSVQITSFFWSVFGHFSCSAGTARSMLNCRQSKFSGTYHICRISHYVLQDFTGRRTL